MLPSMTVAILAALALMPLAWPADAYRHLLANAPAPWVESPITEGGDGWLDGRATWFEHPHTGSCGYGKLDGYDFGHMVAAMPDASPDFRGSCGRCYEIKCRGTQAVSAEGSVNLDRSDACYDTTTSLVIKIVDTCPCNGNEKWCCGDVPHFDLSDTAFKRLAPQGKGIIGLRYRAVPCSTVAGNGTAPPSSSPADWAALRRNVALGAAPEVFMRGDIGQGWRRSIYGDTKRAMYTYDNSLVRTDDGDVALCTQVQQYGGFDFSTDNRDASLFSEVEAVEFWVKSDQGIPDLTFRVSNIERGACGKEFPITSHATPDVKAGWTRFYFPIRDFDCAQSIKPTDLNRLQWENKSPGSQAICVKGVRALLRSPAGAQPEAAAAGR